jgi:hypothetical protein
VLSTHWKKKVLSSNPCRVDLKLAAIASSPSGRHLEVRITFFSSYMTFKTEVKTGVSCRTVALVFDNNASDPVTQKAAIYGAIF